MKLLDEVTYEYRRRYNDEHCNEIKERRKKLRVELLSHYSPSLSCQKCGFSDIRALSMDHINGGGIRHLKQIKGSFYYWLKKNNYPTGFQVLCMNCQFIKKVERNETTLGWRKIRFLKDPSTISFYHQVNKDRKRRLRIETRLLKGMLHYRNLLHNPEKID